jgi:hypothetical protein
MNGPALANSIVPTSLPSWLKCAIATPFIPRIPRFFPLFLFFSLRSKDEVRPSGVHVVHLFNVDNP